MNPKVKTAAKYVVYGLGVIGTGAILLEVPVALIAVAAACYVAKKDGKLNYFVTECRGGFTTLLF